MTKIYSILLMVLSFMLGTMPVSSIAADGARAFDTTNFLSQAQERASMNATEIKHLTLIRSNPNLRNITPLTINRASLSSGLLTVVTPEGKQFQYVGTSTLANYKHGDGKKFVDKSVQTWVGKSTTGGTLILAWDSEGYAGDFTEGGVVYRIASIQGGRFGFVAQTLPMAEEDDTPQESKSPKAGSATTNKR